MKGRAGLSLVIRLVVVLAIIGVGIILVHNGLVASVKKPEVIKARVEPVSQKTPAIIPSSALPTYNFQEVDPKELNARVPGEWEPQQSVLIQWFAEQPAAVGPGVPTAIDAQTKIIELLTENQQKGSKPFIIQVNFPSGNIEYAQKVARASLKKAGVEVDGKKIQFTTIPAEMMNYPRDFGSEMLVDESGKLILANIQFRNYRFFDPFIDTATMMAMISPEAFEEIQIFRNAQAKFNGATQRVSTSLISEGGDREFNGQGVLMAIEDTEVGKRYLGRSWPELLRYYGNTPSGIEAARNLWNQAKEKVENEFKRVFNLAHVIWIPRSVPEDENFLKPGDIIYWIKPGDSIDFSEAKSVLPTGYYLISSANGHIDEMARFVAPDHIVLAEVSEEEASGSEFLTLSMDILENTAEVIKDYSDKNDLNIEITRIPAATPFWYELSTDDPNSPNFMTKTWSILSKQLDGKFIDSQRTPIPAKFLALPALSYANFLVSNNVVIGQKYGDLPEEFLGGAKAKKKIQENDAKAKAVLESIYPNRHVEMVSNISINLQGGGVHCNTRNVPVSWGIPPIPFR